VYFRRDKSPPMYPIVQSFNLVRFLSLYSHNISTINQGWSRCWGRLRPSPTIYIHIPIISILVLSIQLRLVSEVVILCYTMKQKCNMRISPYRLCLKLLYMYVFRTEKDFEGDKASDLHPGGTRLECWPRHRLSQQSHFLGFFSPCRRISG
jgi:hypothetical protein